MKWVLSQRFAINRKCVAIENAVFLQVYYSLNQFGILSLIQNEVYIVIVGFVVYSGIGTVPVNFRWRKTSQSWRYSFVLNETVHIEQTTKLIIIVENH